MTSKGQWHRWQGGHGAVKAYSLRLGQHQLSVKLQGNGLWRASFSRGGIVDLGEFGSVEQAQARCLEIAKPFINDAFDELKMHEALQLIGKGQKGKR